MDLVSSMVHKRQKDSFEIFRGWTKCYIETQTKVNRTKVIGYNVSNSKKLKQTDPVL
jgi:hypothetical protein